jgi:hypothetical protein
LRGTLESDGFGPEKPFDDVPRSPTGRVPQWVLDEASGTLSRLTEPPVLHGPYLHWTRNVAGKTVTRTLTPEQAERYQPWFDNARRLREALSELESRSLKLLLDTEG